MLLLAGKCTAHRGILFLLSEDWCINARVQTQQSLSGDIDSTESLEALELVIEVYEGYISQNNDGVHKVRNPSGHSMCILQTQVK